MDFDIDKVSLLGTKYNNGYYMGWSPYICLDTYDKLKASEQLLLPNGKELKFTDKPINILDYLPKDYVIIDSLGKRVYEDYKEKKTNKGYTIRFPKLNYEINIKFTKDGTLINIPPLNNLTSDLQFEVKELIRLYYLRHSEDNILTNNDLVTNYINEHLNTDTSSLELYIHNLMDYNTLDNIEKLKWENVSALSISKFAKLVNLLSEIGLYDSIDPMVEQLVKITDRHNSYELDISSSVNYISTRMYNVSESPSNYILGLVSVDATTDRVKAIAQRMIAALKSLLFDLKSVSTRILQLILTISGKLNVGIAAASLKTFEAMSLYVYNILEHGTKEELEALIFSLSIAGKQYNMLANSHVNDEGNIKSAKVDKYLRTIDQLEDAFLMISTYLSLAADNAKDPTLAKLNAGPDMLGLYTAGAMIGVSPEILAPIITSPTGILIQAKLSGDILTREAKSSSIDLAIKELLNPSLNMPKDVNDVLLNTLILLYNIYLPLDRKVSTEIPEGDKERQNFILSFFNKLLLSKHRSSILKRVYSLILDKNYTEKYSTVDDFLVLDLEIINYESSNTYKNHTNIENNLNHLIKELEDIVNENPEDTKALEELDKVKEKLSTHISRYNEINNNLIALRNIKSKYTNGITINLLEGDIATIADKIHLLVNYLNSLIEKFNLNLIAKKLEESGLDISRQDIFSWSKNILDELSTIREAIRNSEYELSIWLDDYVKDLNGNLILDSKGEPILVISEILKLAKVSNEALLIRSLLLNLSYPNSPTDAIAWIRKFESIILNAINPTSNAAEEWEAFSDNKLIDIDKYITNENVDFNGTVKPYREWVKYFYDLCKTFINPFRVLDSVEHFLGYLEGMFALYKSLQTMSLLYRTIDLTSLYLILLLNIKDSKSMLLISDNLKLFILHKLNESFFYLLDFTFTCSSDIIDKSEESLPVPINLTLKTIEEREAFKTYMEEEYIPKLISTYGGRNEFLKNLDLIKTDKNLAHTTEMYYGLKETSMPSQKVLSEMDMFYRMKDGLSKLATLNFEGLNAITMLYLYNLIVNEGNPGKFNMTGIFEDFSSGNLNIIISLYNLFVSESDMEGIMETDSDFERLELLVAIAPVLLISSSLVYELRKCKYPYVWILDPNTLQYKLYAKDEVSLEEYDNEDSNNSEEDSDSNYEDETLNAIEEESGFNYESYKESLLSILSRASWHACTLDNLKTSGLVSSINRLSLNHGRITILVNTLGVSTEVLLKNLTLKLIIDNLNKNAIVRIGRTKMTIKELQKLAEDNGWENVLDIIIWCPFKGHYYINSEKTEENLIRILEKNESC